MNKLQVIVGLVSALATLAGVSRKLWLLAERRRRRARGGDWA